MNGHLQVVQILLNAGANANDCVDSQSRLYSHALHLAALRNDDKVVKMLLSAGALFSEGFRRDYPQYTT
ncbi:hypothetical protein COCMIDRAFT_83479 [Bipolaris oryzae ATCC 44560]|uniref:Uncharacterized protein n=1 Tax=Bipolaris oryzae ATCC 44560 TaxID=930090 RepID=W6ZQQ3_COCMI|nr:uncharacterized protein COCMIDRAFT_83479 [Bipolaris oryzae ATCC 44560]EUC49824.1 hypothetical protein COCMIDRAFT_83479 [Bipolaris oryzae ATCC 44560]